MNYCGGFVSACMKVSKHACSSGVTRCTPWNYIFTCRSSSSFLYFSCLSRIWASRASFLVLRASKSRSLLWIWRYFHIFYSHSKLVCQSSLIYSFSILILTSFLAPAISSLTPRTLSTCLDVLLVISSNLFLYHPSISCK